MYNLSHFHGGNASSNLAGDANEINLLVNYAPGRDQTRVTFA